MNINFTYDPGTSIDHMLAFEVAAKVWESYLQDNVTVNLHAGVTSANNLPTGVIGGALPGMKSQASYGEFRNRHWQDAKSSDDFLARQTLYSDANWVKYEHFTWDNNNFGHYESSGTINTTRANAKALGVDLNNSQQGLDGYILLSDLSGTDVSWDLTTNSADAGKLDLLSTALHEIGHALGFISGVDQPGAVGAYFMASNEEWYSKINEAQQVMRDRVKYTNPLDLFRYSSNSWDTPDLTYGSQFSEKYFSIDMGQTALAYFASGSETSLGGDGYQASHWKNSSNARGIMDPTLALGERANMSSLDLKAMDVIGWDVASTGVNTAINLSTFRSQALSELASRIGQTTTWVNNNKASAATQLSQVRVGDIIAMAQDSQVYDLNWMNAYGGVSHWLNWWNSQGGNQSFWLNWWNNGGGNGWWQMMGQAFEQRGLFATIDPSELNVGTAAVEVDALTGLNRQQPVVAATPGDAVSAPPTVSREQFEGFESFAATQALTEASGSGLVQSYGSLAALSLGRGTGRELLGNGLTSLGQDQLQSSLGVTPAFGSEALLG